MGGVKFVLGAGAHSGPHPVRRHAGQASGHSNPGLLLPTKYLQVARQQGLACAFTDGLAGQPSAAQPGALPWLL